MQCGELVTLSAAGRKAQQNIEVHGLYGMIIEIHHNNKHPYKIHWYGSKKRLSSGENHHLIPMSRYEIKKYRVPKCV